MNAQIAINPNVARTPVAGNGAGNPAGIAAGSSAYAPAAPVRSAITERWLDADLLALGLGGAGGEAVTHLRALMFDAMRSLAVNLAVRAVVDWAVLDLIQKGKLKPTDFTFTGSEARPVELGPTLMPRLVEAYEARVGSATAHAASGVNTSFRRSFELQARVFARVVLGGRGEYEGATPAA